MEGEGEKDDGGTTHILMDRGSPANPWTLLRPVGVSCLCKVMLDSTRYHLIPVCYIQSAGFTTHGTALQPTFAAASCHPLLCSPAPVSPPPASRPWLPHAPLSALALYRLRRPTPSPQALTFLSAFAVLLPAPELSPSYLPSPSYSQLPGPHLPSPSYPCSRVPYHPTCLFPCPWHPPPHSL
ncbi:uncharacterized protein LOC144521731 [Sander vitreus]